jgi:hypothetical protein
MFHEAPGEATTDDRVHRVDARCSDADEELSIIRLRSRLLTDPAGLPELVDEERSHAVLRLRGSWSPLLTRYPAQMIEVDIVEQYMLYVYTT